MCLKSQASAEGKKGCTVITSDSSIESSVYSSDIKDSGEDGYKNLVESEGSSMSVEGRSNSSGQNTGVRNDGYSSPVLAESSSVNVRKEEEFTTRSFRYTTSGSGSHSDGISQRDLSRDTPSENNSGLFKRKKPPPPPPPPLPPPRENKVHQTKGIGIRSLSVDAVEGHHSNRLHRMDADDFMDSWEPNNNSDKCTVQVPKEEDVTAGWYRLNWLFCADFYIQ